MDNYTTDVAFEYAFHAEQYCKGGRFPAAIYFYGQAAETILNGIEAGTINEDYRKYAENYITTAEQLKDKENRIEHPKTHQQIIFDRAQFLFSQALDEDENENYKDAVTMYAQAIEYCGNVSKTTNCTDLTRKLKKISAVALERAEELMKQGLVIDKVTDSDLKPKEKELGSQNLVNMLPDVPNTDPSNDINLNLLDLGPSTSWKDSKICGSDSYTKDELDVLRLTSKINLERYLPFLNVDLNERFAYQQPFTDSYGFLPLSSKQRDKFKQWKRPDEFLDAPCIIEKIDSGSIKQTLISDCSFIASLAVSARYEQRFNKRLITNIIYPKNRQGEPIYNPCGKYMVQLHLNGIPRKIIIDDYFPVGSHNEILCSCSQHRNELWVSLLEKAYMKVMGGYDFPGSNSNIDLHALTGWIPDRISLKPPSSNNNNNNNNNKNNNNNNSHQIFDKNKIFEKIFDRFHKGDCLITVATGPLPKKEQDRSGLVECHAYAILDVRKIMGKRLFLCKNPWTHLRWKGHYSERDKVHWTKDLQIALDYKPEDAQQYDDGVFWIDYESICHFFDVFYLNWNPGLFQYTYATHSAWNSGEGPVKDLYSFDSNPQYHLMVKNDVESGGIWILLTRHITDKRDFADNREFITVIVYKGDGKKIYYPFDPPPLIDGTRINSPHYLCKMVVKDPGTSSYTLVVSQYEKFSTIYYTLRIYSTLPFKLKKIVDNFKNTKQIVGEWKDKTAGGCANNHATYLNNPIYHLTVDSKFDHNEICIDLRAPKQYSVGFDLNQLSSVNNKSMERKTTGAFRSGFCFMRLSDVPAGVYKIVPSTFLPNQQGPFILTIKANCKFATVQIQ